MSMKKVTWEYIEGVTALVNLIEMLEAALSEAMPGVKFVRTAGWNWRGLYFEDDLFVGVRYDQPLVLVLENNRGYPPVTDKRDLKLEQVHFFSLTRGKQFECLVEYLRQAREETSDASRDVTLECEAIT